MRSRGAVGDGAEEPELDECVILYTTWPDAETAEACAAEAVANRLAACANLLAPMRSIYRWDGAVERAGEIPLLFKTTRAAAAALRDAILAAHPYDTPCVIALPIEPSASSADFLSWISSEVINPPVGQS